jgi:RNA polymerase sigma factor (sigma-70 family)
MSKGTHWQKRVHQKKGRSQRLETSCAYVISILGSTTVPNQSERFNEALLVINSTLIAFAWFFLGNLPNLARRHELAREAVQIWHRNMLAKGFCSYRRSGKGRPFAPFAIRSLHNICVSLMRELNRAARVASLDDVVDRRNDFRRAFERRELEHDCSELLQSLSADHRECLRLIYWEDLSGMEVAERMGTNPRTVATWHLRGRKRLAEDFRKRGYWRH